MTTCAPAAPRQPVANLPDITTIGGWATAFGAIGTAVWGAVRYIIRPVVRRVTARSQIKHAARAAVLEAQATLAQLKAVMIPVFGLTLDQVVRQTSVGVADLREQFAHLEHQLRISSEMLSFGFMRTDTDGDVLSVDRVIVHMTGREPQELVGRGWYSSISPADRVRVIDALTNAVRNRNEVRIEFVLECLRGVPTSVRMYSRPRYNSGGELLEFTMAVQAMTGTRPL